MPVCTSPPRDESLAPEAPQRFRITLTRVDDDHNRSAYRALRVDARARTRSDDERRLKKRSRQAGDER